MTTVIRGKRDDSGATDEVARLVGIAGARSAPSVALQDSVRIALEHEWRAVSGRRKMLRRRHWLVASLTLLAIIGLGWVTLRQASESPPLTVAMIVGTRGPVQVTAAAGGALIVAGDALAAGARIETGPGGAALLSAGPVGVRVGPNTVLEFQRPGHIRMLRGLLYVDSGETPRLDTLLVATPFGNLTHAGTQYQVEVEPGRFLFMSVREGRVLLQDYGRTLAIARGEGLRVAGINHITRVAVASYDARWQWVSDFVPAFSIEGQSLSVFLAWFARETGRTLVYVAPTTHSDTDRTTMNGSAAGLTPAQALDAVLATTRFRCDLSVPGEMRVSVRASADVSMIGNAAPHSATAAPAH